MLSFETTSLASTNEMPVLLYLKFPDGVGDRRVTAEYQGLRSNNQMN